MSEWLKVQLSKSCVVKATVGSNPTLSGSSIDAGRFLLGLHGLLDQLRLALCHRLQALFGHDLGRVRADTMQGFEAAKDGEDDVILGLQVRQDRAHASLGADVDMEVVLGGDAVLVGLPVLAHQDERSGVGGLEAEHQVEEDEGIRVPGLEVEPIGRVIVKDEVDVGEQPERQQRALDQDEAPRSDVAGDAVSHPLAEGHGVVVEGIDGRPFLVGASHQLVHPLHGVH